MEKKLRLYVWENVLCDYSSGLAVALAHSAAEARQLLLAKIGGQFHILNTVDDLLVEPKIVESPAAFFVYGGG
jgi:hypothetical protein